MKLTTDLVVMGALFGAAAMLDSRRRGAGSQAQPAAEPDFASLPSGFGITPDPGPTELPPLRGIADVDPQPLAQVAAEAIDPDATRAAHEVVIEQRERLPVRGKNIP